MHLVQRDVTASDVMVTRTIENPLTTDTPLPPRTGNSRDVTESAWTDFHLTMMPFGVSVIGGNVVVISIVIVGCVIVLKRKGEKKFCVVSSA